MKNAADPYDGQENKNKLARKSTLIEMPDVDDIPGQENVKPPHLSEFEDTTASSADEEGGQIWDDKLVSDDDINVSEEERNLLRKAANYDSEEGEEELKKAIPDTKDEDGDELNEKFSYKDLSAQDLDIPDEYEDDKDEELGKKPGNY
jgi:hypothetical protein